MSSSPLPGGAILACLVIIAGCCASRDECRGTMQYEGNRYEVRGLGPVGAIEDGCAQHCADHQPGKPDCVRVCSSRATAARPYPLDVTCN